MRNFVGKAIGERTHEQPNRFRDLEDLIDRLITLRAGLQRPSFVISPDGTLEPSGRKPSESEKAIDEAIAEAVRRLQVAKLEKAARAFPDEFVRRFGPRAYQVAVMRERRGLDSQITRCARQRISQPFRHNRG